VLALRPPKAAERLPRPVSEAGAKDLIVWSTLAAALFRGADLADGPVIATLSGGNVDPAQFAQIMAEG
jgi:hypothetical protein